MRPAPVLTGYWTTVTVTGGDGEGYCDVVWQDPAGADHRGEADCYDEPGGSRFEARVSGWPGAGDPTLTETYVGVGVSDGTTAVFSPDQGSRSSWCVAIRDCA